MATTTTQERGQRESAVLAELDEETKTALQLDEIRERTVEPGLMRLPVSQVATSEDNANVTVTVEHPVEGEIDFHLSKPTTWGPENELVRFLDWYDTTVSGIYTLQTRSVYVRRISEGGSLTSDSWELAEPPETVERRDRVVRSIEGAFDRVPTLAFTLPLAFAAILLWPVAGLFALPKYHEKEFGDEPNAEEWVFMYVLMGHLVCAFAWMVVSGFVALLISTLA